MHNLSFKIKLLKSKIKKPKFKNIIRKLIILKNNYKKLNLEFMSDEKLILYILCNIIKFCLHYEKKIMKYIKDSF